MGEDLAVEVRMTAPGLARDNLTVAHALFVDPGAATGFQLESHVLVAGQFEPMPNSRREEDLDTVADGQDPLILRRKLLHDLD